MDDKQLQKVIGYWASYSITDKRDLEARIGIEQGSFTVPSLTHSVSRLTIT